jgi:molybdate transport system permease protein
MNGIDLSPLLISLATTVTATAATFVLGLLAAWRILGMRSTLRNWLDGLLTLPLILPPTVVGYLLLLVFGRRSPVGIALAHLGIIIIFSWPATVIAATVVAFRGKAAPFDGSVRPVSQRPAL